MRYAQLVAAAIPIVAMGALGCSEPDTPSHPSEAPTLATAAAITCIGGDPQNEVPYSEPRVFLESQAWWGKRLGGGGVPRYGDAEHIHVGMCFPLKQTVSGVKRFVVKVMAHNLPVGSVILSTSLHDPRNGEGNVTLKSTAWNRTVTTQDNGDVVLWDTLDVNTAVVQDGLREVRNLTKVRRPPDPGQTVGAEIHASSGWCWQIKNTNDPAVNSGTCASTPFSTMARGWYDCFEYKIAEVRNWTDDATLTTYPWAGIARNASYKLKISGRDGAGANNLVSGWEVRWDPDFHMNKKGFKVDSAAGSATNRSVTVPAAQVTGPKVHKLVIIGFANQRCTTGAGIVPQDGEVTAVLAVPIKVN